MPLLFFGWRASRRLRLGGKREFGSRIQRNRAIHYVMILDRLNRSAELWLQAVEQCGKRRAANRITPASRFNASGLSGSAKPISQQA